MNNQYTLIVNMKTTKQKSEHVKSELLRLMELIKVEQGCEYFVLHQDIEDETKFVVYETWQTKELWQKHSQSPHMSDFNKLVNNDFTDFSVEKLITTNH